MNEGLRSALAIGILLLTLAGIAVGRLPVVRMNRATIAVVGATLLLLLGVLPLGEAWAAVDLSTIVLLFAMMVLNANLRLSGFFDLVTARLGTHSRSPRRLLGVLVFATGALSALFLNDTVVLVFTPLVLGLTQAMGLPPVPYLMAVATAANAGSVATIVGNPQNMLIGVSSGIPFTRFSAYLIPVAAGSLGIIWAVLARTYRADLAPKPLPPRPVARPRIVKPLLWKSLAAAALLAIALLGGMPVPLAALAAASLLLVTRRVRPERVFREIDWSLLVFFAGLFIVTRAAESAGLASAGMRLAGGLPERGVFGLTVIAALLSNVVSNVPAVLLLQPVVAALADPERGWLVLAMATTLAGNLTLLGSVANLIVAESARREGTQISFREYLRAGVPVTLLTLAWGALWLAIVP